MEGVIQYRLLGDHPAASARYLTLGFPGVTTTRDKVLEQVIQENRINTSRYKLEVRKLVSGRDAAGYKAATSPQPPPPVNELTDSNSNDKNSNGGSNATSNAVVVGAAAAEDSGAVGTSWRDAVVLHSNEELHTYDRLVINVSHRQLADDDALRKEQEQLEQQRRVREMEEELLATTATMTAVSAASSSPPPPLQLAQAGSASSSVVTPPPPLPSSTAATPQDTSRSPGRGVVAAAVVDGLRLQRAAALASQLFPILKGQHNTLTGIDDPANTHQCVLCRFPAFEEQLTPCCHFCVCTSCYTSAAEMDMEEGRCPVCGAKNAMTQQRAGNGSISGHGLTIADGGSGTLKRVRESDVVMSHTAWKVEEAAESKDLLHRTLGLGERGGDDRHCATSASRSALSAPVLARGAAAAAAPSSTAAVAAPKEVLQLEERLRHDLEKALASLDGPDMISTAAKQKRVMSAELTALCEE
ncbi:hypothetical protein N2W54_001367 [Lotmaria passim]